MESAALAPRDFRGEGVRRGTRPKQVGRPSPSLHERLLLGRQIGKLSSASGVASPPMSMFHKPNATGLMPWLCATTLPLFAFSCASLGAQQPPWEGCRAVSIGERAGFASPVHCHMLHHGYGYRQNNQGSFAAISSDM